MSHQAKNRAQFLIRLGYLGHYFHGVQPQKNVVTVGQALKDHLTKSAGVAPSALQFAARTDKGVHALMTFATCWFGLPFDEEQFKKNLKQTAHPGLLSISVFKVPFFVHARAHSRGKHYRYAIEDSCDIVIRKNPYTWQIAPTLDIKRMQIAASYMEGEHDFTSFRASGCTANTSVKTMFRISVTRLPSRQIHIDIVGNAFLRQMIRIIVGTLVETGAGLRPVQDITDILKAQDRYQAGVTAPAQGLTLMQIGFAWPPDKSNLLPGRS